jgi:hypothetical protein
MIRVVHPGSGLFTHPGSQIQGSKRHRIPNPDPQHWFFGTSNLILHAQEARTVTVVSQPLSPPGSTPTSPTTVSCTPSGRPATAYAGVAARTRANITRLQVTLIDTPYLHVLFLYFTSPWSDALLTFQLLRPAFAYSIILMYC